MTSEKAAAIKAYEARFGKAARNYWNEPRPNDDRWVAFLAGWAARGAADLKAADKEFRDSFARRVLGSYEQVAAAMDEGGLK